MRNTRQTFEGDYVNPKTNKGLLKYSQNKTSREYS